MRQSQTLKRRFDTCLTGWRRFGACAKSVRPGLGAGADGHGDHDLALGRGRADPATLGRAGHRTIGDRRPVADHPAPRDVVDREPGGLLVVGAPLRTSLRAHGYDVAWQRTAHGALREADNGELDLVLLDLGLPTWTGSRCVAHVHPR